MNRLAKSVAACAVLILTGAMMGGCSSQKAEVAESEKPGNRYEDKEMQKMGVSGRGATPEVGGAKAGGGGPGVTGPPR